MTDDELWELQIRGHVTEQDTNDPGVYTIHFDQTRTYGPVSLFVARMLKRELQNRSLSAWIEVE